MNAQQPGFQCRPQATSYTPMARQIRASADGAGSAQGGAATGIGVMASAAENAIDIARHGDTVYAQIAGLGNFNNAGPFREFVDSMIQDGARNIVLDLVNCTGLDSTFLGTLMGFLTCPLRSGGEQQSASESLIRVTIVNLNPVTDRAISSLGLKCLFDVRETPVQVPPLKLRRLRDGWDDPNQRVRLIREAHEHLVAHDKANAEKFGPFIQMLLKDQASKNNSGA